LCLKIIKTKLQFLHLHPTNDDDLGDEDEGEDDSEEDSDKKHKRKSDKESAKRGLTIEDRSGRPGGSSAQGTARKNMPSAELDEVELNEPVDSHIVDNSEVLEVVGQMADETVGKKEGLPGQQAGEMASKKIENIDGKGSNESREMHSQNKQETMQATKIDTPQRQPSPMDKGIQQGGLPEAIEDSNKIQRFNDTSGEVGKIDLGVEKLGREEKGFLIPDHSPDNMEMEMMECLIV
jgi:hypothetical protein